MRGARNNESPNRLTGHERTGRSQVGPALMLLLAMAPLLAWPWLSGAMAIPWDAKAHFLPQIQFLAQSLARGDSPFWAPYVFGGHPQIADPQSLLFSPTYLLLALIDGTPDPWVVDILLIAMVVAGGISLMFWARDREWHWGGALIAALCFCWGASMAWRIQHVGQVLSLVWLPVALFCIERTLQRSSLLWGLVAGLVLARIATGRDQVALLGLYLLAAYSLWRLIGAHDPSQDARDRGRALAGLVLAACVALALSAVPILFTALLAQESNRPEIGLVDAGKGSLHPALLLTLMMPDVFGATGRGDDYWGPPSAAWPDTGLFLAQNMGGLYVGALPLALILVAAHRGWVWERSIRFFTLAAIVAALYALGWYTPVFSVFHSLVPGVSLFRRPADATFLLGASLSILAGYSAHRLLSTTRNSPAPRAGALAASALIPGAVATLTAIGLAIAHDRLPRLTQPLVETLLSFTLAAIALAWAARSVRQTPGIVAACLAALTAADLAFHNGPSSATAQPAGLYEVLEPDSNNETIAMLKSYVVTDSTRRDRIELTGLGFHWPNVSLTHGLENILGYNPLRLGAYSAATGAEDHVGLPDQRRFSPLFPSYRCQLANLLGLRFIATGIPIEQIDRTLAPGEFKLIARTADAWIYENTQALPRIIFATEAVGADFDHIIASGQWPAVDLQHTVLLEEPVEAAASGGPALVAPAVTADRSAGGAPPVAAGRRPGEARLVRYSNTEIDIDVDSPDGGWVVLNDIWHPWWFAQLAPERDGPELEILRANVLFRAVAVEAGRHRIRFEFRPLEGAWQQLVGSRDSGEKQ